MRLREKAKQALEAELEQLQRLLRTVLDQGGHSEPFSVGATTTRPRRAHLRARFRRYLPQASALL